MRVQHMRAFVRREQQVSGGILRPDSHRGTGLPCVVPLGGTMQDKTDDKKPAVRRAILGKAGCANLLLLSGIRLLKK